MSLLSSMSLYNFDLSTPRQSLQQSHRRRRPQHRKSWFSGCTRRPRWAWEGPPRSGTCRERRNWRWMCCCSLGRSRGWSCSKPEMSYRSSVSSRSPRSGSQRDDRTRSTQHRWRCQTERQWKPREAHHKSSSSSASTWRVVKDGQSSWWQNSGATQSAVATVERAAREIVESFIIKQLVVFPHYRNRISWMWRWWGVCKRFHLCSYEGVCKRFHLCSCFLNRLNIMLYICYAIYGFPSGWPFFRPFLQYIQIYPPMITILSHKLALATRRAWTVYSTLESWLQYL